MNLVKILEYNNYLNVTPFNRMWLLVKAWFLEAMQAQALA